MDAGFWSEGQAGAGIRVHYLAAPVYYNFSDPRGHRVPINLEFASSVRFEPLIVV